MSNRIEQCHALYTLIIMLGGGTEWTVEYTLGSFIAKSGEGKKEPKPCRKYEDARDEWTKFFNN